MNARSEAWNGRLRAMLALVALCAGLVVVATAGAATALLVAG
ncbi:hypothetical protein Cfla_0136 [Cellulomonas flavigena DSM 20109]|uniref:Uncharacterized protein n=1 Tax=Cellulomonas flavigena (strain ATCC 482 / DSM 20109 / BCRC 11376 / JCM 18109 / NBRC 3775 / NCIMB 8073 / NRS 134) TaxID=446466 RepID=D5UFU7_CELFN|nr:hypothetical protein [Cellulomonas flavigena]ADG73056.1 hypothetical protein Cfla_0136 [Cellulomonas flavigena DSM 20109]